MIGETADEVVVELGSDAFLTVFAADEMGTVVADEGGGWEAVSGERGLRVGDESLGGIQDSDHDQVSFPTLEMIEHGGLQMRSKSFVQMRAINLTRQSRTPNATKELDPLSKIRHNSVRGPPRASGQGGRGRC